MLMLMLMLVLMLELGMRGSLADCVNGGRDS